MLAALLANLPLPVGGDEEKKIPTRLPELVEPPERRRREPDPPKEAKVEVKVRPKQDSVYVPDLDFMIMPDAPVEVVRDKIATELRAADPTLDDDAIALILCHLLCDD